jgi:hypothetical protein
MNEIQVYQDLTQDEAEMLISRAFRGVMTQEDFDDSVIREYCVVQCGEVHFDTPELAEEATSRLEEWVNDMNSRNYEQVTDEPFPHLQIDDFEYHEPIKAVTFQVFSETEKGIRDQLSIFLDFCKTLPGIKKFDAPILQTIDPVTWERK